MGQEGRTLHSKSRMLLQALGLTLAVSACEQPTTFVPGVTDRFTSHSSDSYAQAKKVLQADYVFVVDFSYSMSDGNAATSSKLQQLYSSMSDFTADLKSQNIDYNIGFVKGNTHSNSASTISTNFVAPFLTLSSTSSGLDSSILTQVQNVGGALQENTNYLLEASLRVMNAQGSSFMRPAAQLVYVYISDSDDLSHKNSRITGAKTTSYYSNKLRAFKSDPSYVSARSFTAGEAIDCELRNVWEVAGTRIAAVAQSIDALETTPGCIYDPMAESLYDLARDVTRTTKRFTLRGKPEPSSIQIFVDGEEVDSEEWIYTDSTNEVVFNDGQEPRPDSQLTINYEMLYPLGKNPKVGTLTVTVNGAAVPKSETNGWSYISSENRIQFNGAAVPPQEADVRVTYTLR